MPAAKSKLPHVAIHGAFLVVREAGLSWKQKHRCLREPKDVDTSLRVAHEVKGWARTSGSVSPLQDDRSGLGLQ
jgi:hypothetical protein